MDGSVQIWKSSPPMEDVPRNLPEEVYSLIRDGWMVDKAARPGAAKLLEHKAFRLLGQCFVLIFMYCRCTIALYCILHYVITGPSYVLLAVVCRRYRLSSSVTLLTGRPAAGHMGGWPPPGQPCG